MVLKIELLDSRKHIRSDFCCGKDSLDNYIRKQASQDLKRKVATIFVLVDESENHPKTEILGYYTLSNYTIDITELDTALAKTLPRYPQLPATLLGRLAVNCTQTGTSLAVIAEAIDEQAAQFYLKYGFQRFNHQSTKFYLPMKSIELLEML